MAKTKPVPVRALSRYEAIVKQAREMVEETRRGLLSAYWELGKMATSIVNPQYGQHTVEEFSSDIGLERSTVYVAIQFNRAYNKKEDLERAIRHGLSWSHVRLLVHEKINPKTREKLEKRVADEQMSVRDFQKEIQRIVGRKNQPSARVPKTAVAVFTKICSIAKKLNSMLPAAYVDAMKAAKKLKGQSKEDANEAMLLASKELLDLAKKLKAMSK